MPRHTAKCAVLALLTALTPTAFAVAAEPTAADSAGIRQAALDYIEGALANNTDITRLLDRLADRGLVARARERADRRVITARMSRSRRDRSWSSEL